MWNWLGGVERRENQIDGEHSCSLFFFLGDVVKDRLCFPVLYSFVFSKWTTMSSCFLETRKKKFFERGGDNWSPPRPILLLPKISWLSCLWQTLIHFREFSFEVSKSQWTQIPKTVLDSRDVYTWWEWFFHTDSPSCFRKSFQSHPDCLRISLATLSVSEIENNSLSSCNFFLFSKLPLLAEGYAGIWGQVLVQLQINAAYSDPGEEQEGRQTFSGGPKTREGFQKGRPLWKQGS